MYGFDVYYKDPLNKAHLFERKADKCVKNEKYGEAIDYHLQAVKLLQDVLDKNEPIIVHRNAILSLELQLQYHQRQEKLIMLRKRQLDSRNKNMKNSSQGFMRSSAEAFQNVNTYSTTSIDSYDSTDYVSTSTISNNNNSANEQLVKRDDIIKKMGSFIRQQQNEILALSGKLKEKDKENKLLRETVRDLEDKCYQLGIDEPVS